MMEKIIIGITYLLLFGVIYLLKKKLNKTEHYDEMQLQIRADAYKYAYGTTVVLLAGLIFMVVVDEAAVPSFILSGVLIIIMLSGVLVFGVYCIRHDSFFFIGQDWRRYFWLCIAVDSINLFTLVTNLFDLSGEMEPMERQELIANIITETGIVVFFTVIIVMIVTKMISDKKDAEV